MIVNKTPYYGRLRFKFEKHPHYTGGGSGVLNKVHLNLGFTKLVSRMIPYKNDNGWVVSTDCTKLISKFTGGKVGSHTFHDGEHTLYNSFLTNDGKYIGDIETGWWYYNNNLVICEDYPHGVAIKLKENNYFKKYDRTYHSSDLNLDGDAIGYYGYSHRGGALFQIGDRVFDNYYLPTKSDYTQEEWDGYNKKYQDSLSKADEFDKKWIFSDGIASVIPFNKRGKKVIKTWEDAKEAAISLSKYLG
jgi:hypothetical protein